MKPLVGRPKGTINSLEELQNIVVLGLDVWYVGPDSELNRLTDLKLMPRTCGLALCSSGRTPVYIQYCSIYDKTFDKSIIYHSSICGYLFSNVGDAQVYVTTAFKKFAAGGPIHVPA